MHELVAMKTAIAKSGRESVSHFIAHPKLVAWVVQADKRAGQIHKGYRIEIIDFSLKFVTFYKNRSVKN